MTTFSKVTHWGGAFLAVSHASHLKGMKPQRTQVFGVPSSYFYTLRRRITEVGVVTHIGRLVHVSAGQARHCVLHDASRVLSAIIMSFLCCVGNAVKVIQGKRYQQQASVHHILQVASLDHDFHAIEYFVWSAAEISINVHTAYLRKRLSVHY